MKLSAIFRERDGQLGEMANEAWGTHTESLAARKTGCGPITPAPRPRRTAHGRRSTQGRPGKGRALQRDCATVFVPVSPGLQRRMPRSGGADLARLEDDGHCRRAVVVPRGVGFGQGAVVRTSEIVRLCGTVAEARLEGNRAVTALEACQGEVAYLQELLDMLS